MKKFYALLAAATLGFTAANALEIEGNRGVLTDSEFNQISSFTLLYEDGVYRIENMLGHSAGWDGDIYYYDNVFEMTIDSYNNVSFDPAAPKGFYESYDQSTGTVIGLFLQNYGWFYSDGIGNDYNRAIWLSYYTTNYSTGENEYKNGYVFWNEVEAYVVQSWECNFSFNDEEPSAVRTVNQMSDGTYQILNAFGTGSSNDMLTFTVEDGHLNFKNMQDWNGYQYLYYGNGSTFFSYVYGGEYSVFYLYEDTLKIQYYIYNCDCLNGEYDYDNINGLVTLSTPADAPKAIRSWKCDEVWDWDRSNILGTCTVNQLNNGTFQIENAFGEGTPAITFTVPTFYAGVNYWNSFGSMKFLGLEDGRIEYADGLYEDISYGYFTLEEDSVYGYIYVWGDAGYGYLCFYYPAYPKQDVTETYEGRTTQKFARVAFKPLVPYQMGEAPSVDQVYWDCVLETYEDAPYVFRVKNAFGTGDPNDYITFSITEDEDVDAETAATEYGEPYLTHIGNFTFGEEYVTYVKALKKKKVTFGDNIIWVYDAEVADGERSQYRAYNGEVMNGQNIRFRFDNQKGGVEIPGCPGANTGELIITWGETNYPAPEPAIEKVIDVAVCYSDNYNEPYITSMYVYDDGTYSIPAIFGEGYANDDLTFQIVNDNLEVTSYSFLMNGYKYWTIYDESTHMDKNVQLTSENYWYYDQPMDWFNFPFNNWAYFRTNLCGYVDIFWNEDATTGISSVETAAEGEAVYYNLSGIRVENPTQGIYIVKQGAKVSKQVIR